MKIDAANLCITNDGYSCSAAAAESSDMGRLSEEEHLQHATIAAQKLFSDLNSLPSIRKRGKKESATTLLELPAPEIKLPREKAPPQAKPLTAWQKFALKKGIALNRKKSNRVWNEERQEWTDKWGKRAREDERKYDWVREVKADYVAQEDGGDPFLDDRRKKQEKLDKQAKNEARNKRREELMTRAASEVKGLESTMTKLATSSKGKFDVQESKAKMKTKFKSTKAAKAPTRKNKK